MPGVIKIFTDGGSRGNPGPAALGVVIEHNGEVIAELSQYLGIATNNEAEYQAFLASAKWLQEHQPDAEKVNWVLDSMLVVQQLNQNWKIKEARLQTLARECWQTLDSLPYSYTISHVLRHLNAEADKLVNQALDGAAATA